jgi:hypothetical protein
LPAEGLAPLAPTKRNLNIARSFYRRCPMIVLLLAYGTFCIFVAEELAKDFKR